MLEWFLSSSMAEAVKAKIRKIREEFRGRVPENPNLFVRIT